MGISLEHSAQQGSKELQHLFELLRILLTQLQVGTMDGSIVLIYKDVGRSTKVLVEQLAQEAQAVFEVLMGQGAVKETL